ncbi:MAG: slipin family protein [Parahaliea sp.]
MMLWKTYDIADNERALLFRRNRFKSVLLPGRHRIARTGGSVRVETFDISEVIFSHPIARFLLSTHAGQLSAHLECFELSDQQVGLLYRDDKLADVLVPGSYLTVWKGVEKIRLEIVDISEHYQVDKSLLGLLGRGSKLAGNRNIASAVNYIEVPNEHLGLLTVNGTFEGMLEPGSHGFWQFNRSVGVKLLDLRLQPIEVSGQEILTRDRVSLRINLSGSYRVVEPETVALKLNDYVGFIYQELQLRLREAVGTQSLDVLLEDKDALNSKIAEGASARLAHYGIELMSIGVKDIILPGDMKDILNQVVQAQKESEANLIKRREETQAMRSLHNTAKMMENNPILLRLKELEALERVSGQIDRISVYGGLDGVLNDLVKLAPAVSAQ